VILGGERDMNAIPGFHLGNSPLEYTKEHVEGKMAILATTNGTRAIQRARKAQTLYIGSMLNGTAVAQKIADSKKDTTIICAGTDEKYSLDDILTMGYIVSRVRKLMPGQKLKMDDLCRASLYLYDSKKLRLMEALKDSRHYRALMAAGYYADIEYCMRPDVYDLVPFFSEGEVRI
jgi:2-phosphosulfolactate phosphatase